MLYALDRLRVDLAWLEEEHDKLELAFRSYLEATRKGANYAACEIALGILDHEDGAA